jgi:hypothetical protein
LKKYGATVFLESLALLERRRSRGFDIDKTIAIIRDSAFDQRFLNYRDIAQASGLEWSSVHWAIGPHLVAVCEYARGKGWPLLSAIVVNADKVGTGEMKSANLEGFVTATHIVGRDVGSDCVQFVQREQKRVFDWARNKASS